MNNSRHMERLNHRAESRGPRPSGYGNLGAWRSQSSRRGMPGRTEGGETVITNAGRLAVNEQLAQLRAALTRNKSLITVLERAAKWDLPGWYLVAGCLYQTVWNVVTGRPPQSGILDYDLIYFDGSDLSWAAENALIRESEAIFADMPAPVQIRNQARVHLWYQEKFAAPCQAHESSEAAIDTLSQTLAMCAFSPTATRVSTSATSTSRPDCPGTGQGHDGNSMPSLPMPGPGISGRDRCGPGPGRARPGGGPA